MAVVSLVIASLFYGDANIPARKIIDKTYARIAGNPLSYDITADENGIPFLIEATVGRQRNPVTICNSALTYLVKAKAGDEIQKRYFINCSNWIVDNRTFRNDTTSVLEYKYDWAIYNLKAPWQSGMAQGLSLQVLINAYDLTKDERYVRAAQEQLNSFFVEVKDNGVTYKSQNDGWWYEEFSDNGGKESRVLNGMMFAVLGIYEYYQHTHDAKAKFLFDQGALAVKTALPLYEKDGFSYYDQLHTPCNLKYHRIHVVLLQQMFESSGEQIFREYSEKWGRYKDPNFLARVLKGETKKIYIAMFGVNTILLFLLQELIFVSIWAITKKKNNHPQKS